MCGIAGIINLNKKEIDAHQLQNMVKILSHRGPDGNGIFIDNNVGLAHTRLSIIDLSNLARQPMSYNDNNYQIIHNGEIYNYIELREELKKDGFYFKTASDTEVIVASYIKWGESCVTHFNGMWAFVIYDVKNKKIFASRDRFGVKPFYYYKDNEKFIFASEIKAILEAESLKKTNYSCLYRLLNTGSLDEGDETFYENIKQLKAAHCLVLQDNDFKIYKYWDYYETAKEKYDYKNAEETFLSLLTSSIKLRYRADVPVGACLSGGLDSSSIVTLSTKLLDCPIHTFSSIYEDEDCNESYYIDIVNKFNKTIPHYVYPVPQDFIDIIKKITYHQDEPTAGPGLYSQWHVMKTAQDHVKVLLDGQGADELLGGYFYFFGYYFSEIKKEKNKIGAIAAAQKILNEYPKIKELTGMNSYAGMYRIISEIFLPRFLSNIFNTPLLKRNINNKSFLTAEFTNNAKCGNKQYPEIPKKFENELENALYKSLVQVSIPSLLHYEDRNSMAFSIESRVPFLDYRLVEFCLGLPADERIKADMTKVIMRKALKGILPDEVTYRRDKKGYPTPFARWLREDIKNDVVDILFSNRTRQRKIFNMEFLEKEFKRHINGEIDISWQIWRYLTTELWFQEFIDSV